MITDADRAKYGLPVKPNGPKSIIEIADEKVDIRDILKQMGIWAPDGDYYSYKIWCPWHEEHPDQLDKNCRIFGGTNIYCWAGHGYITPTYLYSRWKGMPRNKAAEELLDQRGLLHKPWYERWNDLARERDEKQQHKLGNKSDFFAALTVALASNPVYVRNEYNPVIRERWQVILKTADHIWEFSTADLDLLNEFFDAALTALLKLATMVDKHGEINE